MSNSAAPQLPRAGCLGTGQDNQGPPNVADYLRQPGWREPHCPRCTYRAANVGKALRKFLPTVNILKAFEIIGELACTTPAGEEQSGIQCDCCRTYRRNVEFHYPPGRGFEESSARLWKSLLDLAGHCLDLDAKPNSWDIGLREVEQASRDFLACWHEVCRQHGKDLLQMSAQELRQMGCPSVVTVPGVANPMAGKSTSAVPTRPDGPGVSLGSVLNEVHKMGKDFNKFASEFHSHAENTKTEIELLSDTAAQLEADFAKIQIQDRDLATSLEGHSEKLMSEIKELAQFVKAQSRTLSAVKIQVDRLAINFSTHASAALAAAGTGEQRE